MLIYREKAQGKDSHYKLKRELKETMLPIFWSQTSSLQCCKKMNFRSLCTQSMVICYASPSKLIYLVRDSTIYIYIPHALCVATSWVIYFLSKWFPLCFFFFCNIYCFPMVFTESSMLKYPVNNWKCKPEIIIWGEKG